MRVFLIMAGAVAALHCTPRTVIHPTPPQAATPDKFVQQGGCNVRDFSTAAEVPSGSKNIGWITVEQQGSDEETYLLLRSKICEMGGDALSQPAWVKGPSEDQPKLTANAWSLP